MLNPDTNSDSPSAKSKGARFVSARALVNQTKAIGNSNKPTGNPFTAIVSHENLSKEKALNNSTNRSLTS